MTEEIKNIMREEIEEIKNRLAEKEEETGKAYDIWKDCYDKLEEKALAEERYEMVYDHWACRYVKSVTLTDEEDEIQAKLRKEYAKLSKERYEIRKELDKAKKEQKTKREIAKGIDPEKKKAKTYARRYENEIEKLQKQIAELTEKKNYWEEKAK